MEITSEAIDFIKSKLPLPNMPLQAAYNAGYDCGLNGATLQNCHFSVFSSPQNTAAWNEGKADAEQGRKNKYSILSSSDGAKTTTP